MPMSMKHELVRVGLVSETAETEGAMTQQRRGRNDRSGGRPDRGDRGRQDRGRGGRRDSGRDRDQRGYRERFSGPFFELDESGNSSLKSAFVRKKGVDQLAYDLANASPALTTGQIRRFFNHCRGIERRLQTDGATWDQVSASFEMMSSHAQYAVSSNKIPPLFQEFIDANVDRVASADDPGGAFRDGFLKHFEALVGYGAQHFREGN